MFSKNKTLAIHWVLKFQELRGEYEVWRDANGKPKKIAFLHPQKSTSSQRRELLHLHRWFEGSSRAVKKLIITDLAAASPDGKGARRGATGRLLPRTARVERIDPNGRRLGDFGAQLARLGLSHRNDAGEAPRAAIDIIVEHADRVLAKTLGPDATDEEISDARAMIADAFSEMSDLILTVEKERGGSPLN